MEHNTDKWNLKLWLWAFLCTFGILITVPVARGLQKFVYATVGKEFFTYIVLAVFFTVLVILLYLFIFRFRIRKTSQYLWLFLCAGLYAYFTVKLKKHPEEAVHFLEYGLLSFFVFRALSHRIRDWTVYPSTAAIVSFVGALDEFIQWLLPSRVWDYADIGLNILGGIIFLIGVWKGFRPDNISRQPEKISFKVLIITLTSALLFLSFCLLNTPLFVKNYTSGFESMAWLRSEEPMTEYGFKHKDEEFGILYSRMSLDELKDIDSMHGRSYGEVLTSEQLHEEDKYNKWQEIYTVLSNPFMHEFIIHVKRRDDSLKEINNADNEYDRTEARDTALRENMILEKYFSDTLMHSGLLLTQANTENLESSVPFRKSAYTSRVGKLITAFSQSTVLIFIAAILIAIWAFTRIKVKQLES